MLGDNTCSLDSIIYKGSCTFEMHHPNSTYSPAYCSLGMSTCPNKSKILGSKYPNLSPNEMIYITRGADSFDFVITSN